MALNKPFYFFLIAITINNLHSQDRIYNIQGSGLNKIGTKCRLYKSKEDFLKNTNHQEFVLAIYRESSTSFIVRPFYKDIKKKELNNRIFAIVTNKDTLINMRYFSDRKLYGKLSKKLDSFYITKSNPDNTAALMFGLAGAAIAAATSKATPIAITPNIDRFFFLSKSEIKYVLNQFEDKTKFKEFKKEKDYTVDVMLSYLKYYLENKSKLYNKAQ